MTTNERATEILLAAVERIGSDTWTQRTSARDAYGRSVSALVPPACRWCAVGFVHREAFLHHGDAEDAKDEALHRLDRAAKKLGLTWDLEDAEMESDARPCVIVNDHKDTNVELVRRMFRIAAGVEVA